MANPLSSETQIYQKIKNENIVVHPLVWELMDHHIGNDIQAVQFIAGNYVVSKKLEDIPAEDGKKILARCEEMRKFLKKLKEATKKD
ncbi:MAG TPA: hypothetical protein PLH56_01600 [Candidatus Omnitrophota bacterium]|nr:hypothetical protein [Candidatus Omnitrophota bacterium]HPN88012.1 hypothetical protein [Candidatus Omnitrophota bacterium]